MVAATVGMLTVEVVGLNGFAMSTIAAKSTSPTSVTMEYFDRLFLNLDGGGEGFISRLHLNRRRTAIIPVVRPAIFCLFPSELVRHHTAALKFPNSTSS